MTSLSPAGDPVDMTQVCAGPLVVRALDWFSITGRGMVVSVNVAETDEIGSGDRVRFVLSPNSPGQQGVIAEDKTYVVAGVEESRCLVDHGPGSRQCTMSRALAVRAVEE